MTPSHLIPPYAIRHAKQSRGSFCQSSTPKSRYRNSHIQLRCHRSRPCVSNRSWCRCAALSKIRMYTLCLTETRTDVHSTHEEKMNSHTQQVVIGLLAERATGERSFALIPSDIKRLLSKAKFLVESVAAHAASALISNSQYIFDPTDVFLNVSPLS